VSLHQPSAALLQHCDQVLLLSNGGKVLFWGPPPDLGPFLERALGGRGSEACLQLRPPLGSDFEFALSAASADHSTDDALALSAKRLQVLQEAWRAAAADTDPVLQTQQAAASSSPLSALTTDSLGCSLRRWQWLLWRAWRLAGASPVLVLVRVAANLVTALIFGAIFYQLPPTQVTVAARKGLCQVVCNYAAMTSMVKTLGAFRTESQLVARERASGLYSCFSFYTAKVVAELPLSLFLTALLGGTTHFLTHPPAAAAAAAANECSAELAASGVEAAACVAAGAPQWLGFVGLLALLWQVGSALGLFLGALMPSVDAALELGKMLTMVSIIFGGLYFNESTLPHALRWVPRVSPVKRAFEGLAANEFRGLVFEDGPQAAASKSSKYAVGTDVLLEMGLVGGGGDDGSAIVRRSVLVLLASVCVLHVLAFAVLAFVKRPRFVRPKK